MSPKNATSTRHVETLAKVAYIYGRIALEISAAFAKRSPMTRPLEHAYARASVRADAVGLPAFCPSLIYEHDSADCLLSWQADLGEQRNGAFNGTVRLSLNLQGRERVVIRSTFDNRDASTNVRVWKLEIFERASDAEPWDAAGLIMALWDAVASHDTAKLLKHPTALADMTRGNRPFVDELTLDDISRIVYALVSLFCGQPPYVR